MPVSAASSADASDYHRMARSLAWLGEHFRERPTLADMAGAAGVSPGHYAHLFRRWAGVSPGRYLRALQLAAAKGELDAGAPILDASLGAGLSGPSRLHDLFVDFEAVTPGDYRRRGAGLALGWEVAESPFGLCFIAVSPRGIAWMSFVEDAEEGVAALAARWPAARLVRDGSARGAIEGAFGRGARPRVATLGTNFQVRVWRALLALPPGATTTYGALARSLGRPESARAVGSAVGANPVAYLIPCHRVLRGDGALGGYRWGEERKRAILAWELLQRL